MRFIIFFTLVLLTACNNKNKDTSIVKQNLKNNQSNKVVVLVKTDDTSLFNIYDWHNNTNMFGKHHAHIVKKNLNDSIVLILDSINKPQLMEFLSFAKNDFVYRARMYVTPGDTITFKIENEKMEFFGKHANHYNFLTHLDTIKHLDYGKNPLKNGLLEYKRTTQEIYQTRLNLFNEFIEKNEVSSDFKQAVEQDLKFQYLANLISPRMDDSGIPGLYTNRADAINYLIAEEYSNNEQFFNLKDYFDGVTLEEFTNAKIPSSFYFKNSVNRFVRYYFDDSNYSAFSKEKLIAEISFIEQHFEGELKEYALARTIWEFDQKGFGSSKLNIEFLSDLINKYANEFKNESCIEEINKIKTNLLVSNFELPAHVMKTKLLNTSGDTLTLYQVLNKHNTNLKVLNFWATWCNACIKEMDNAQTFKKDMITLYDIDWIYMSIDRNRETWQSKLDAVKGITNKNHYLLLKDVKSSLGNYIKLLGVPRYTILDRENHILLNSAPKPTDSLFFADALKNIAISN